MGIDNTLGFPPIAHAGLLKHRNQAALQGSDHPLYLSLGLGRWGNTMGNLQGQKHAAAFSDSIFPFVAEHRETVGIKHFRDAMICEGSP